MTYDVYRYIFIGAAVLSLLCLIVAVLLFFALGIPKVIGDLTGYTTKKAIEKIKSQNDDDVNNGNKSGMRNRGRETLTDKITPSGKIVEKSTVFIDDGGMATSKISTGRLENEAYESYETSLLDNQSSEQTTLLDLYENPETTVSEQTDEVFTIEREILFVFSDEIIV